MSTRRPPSAFEKYPHEYDLMTNAAAREKPHGREVDALIRRFSPETVLDAGCASGLTTQLFAERGVVATGLDCAPGMIAAARRRFKQRGIDADLVEAFFEDIPATLDHAFDLVVCLANSITGVETSRGLSQAMRSFHRVLRPGGWLVLQALNYHAVEEGTLFPIKGTESDGIVYERFSERRGKTLSIYLTRLDLNQDPAALEVFRHDFDAFDPQKLKSTMTAVGLKPVRSFGNLLMNKRFSGKSRDIVLVGRRPVR